MKEARRYARSDNPLAREVALQVLLRVEQDGAYAQPTLDGELRRRGCGPHEARLATYLVFGVLRAQSALDDWLRPWLRTPLHSMDAALRAALRLGCFQLRLAERIAPAVAVHSAVALVRRRRGPRLAAVANAVLRRVQSERHPPPSLSRQPADRQLDTQSLQEPARPLSPRTFAPPMWLRQALTASLSAVQWDALLAAAAVPPSLSLRLLSRRAPLASVRAELCRELDRLGIAWELGDLHAATLRVHRPGDLRRWPAYARGDFVVQDSGAQLVGAALPVAPGDHVLDACAGHGNKTVAFCERSLPKGWVLACDLRAAKLRQLKTKFDRLGIARSCFATSVRDFSLQEAQPQSAQRHATARASASGPEPRSRRRAAVLERQLFDAVCVDAPCSGLGTVLRRPELMHRIPPTSRSALTALQGAILSRAASFVRPGGVLVYAVCSPLHEEGAEVAAAFSAEHPDFNPAADLLRASMAAQSPNPRAVAALDCDATGVFALGPWLTSSLEFVDMYQVVGWRRKA